MSGMSDDFEPSGFFTDRPSPFEAKTDDGWVARAAMGCFVDKWWWDEEQVPGVSSLLLRIRADEFFMFHPGRRSLVHLNTPIMMCLRCEFFGPPEGAADVTEVLERWRQNNTLVLFRDFLDTFEGWDPFNDPFAWSILVGADGGQVTLPSGHRMPVPNLG